MTSASRPDVRRSIEPTDVVAVGDVHARFDHLVAIASRVPLAPILQVGDLTGGGSPIRPEAGLPAQGNEPAAGDGPEARAQAEPTLWSRLHWVPGNREDPSLLHLGNRLRPGQLLRIGAITIAGLGGVYCPGRSRSPRSTWPWPDDPRCYSVDDIETLLHMEARPVILLAHDVPPAVLDGRGDANIARLVDALRPAVFLGGHHHRFAHARLGDTEAFALPRASKGYLELHFQGAALRGWLLRELTPARPPRRRTAERR